jgi:AcrR family transcriptional regulator
MRGVKNEELKLAATKLILKGFSYPMIAKELGTPKATMNSWFKGLKLSDKTKAILLQRKQNHLLLVRQKAIEVLRKNRFALQEVLRQTIEKDFSRLELSAQFKELLLTMLYLGEGFKMRSTVGMGNSNSEIMAAFVTMLREIYNVADERFSCYLHLRCDQDSEQETIYWSKIIKIGKDRFRKPQFDKRTLGIRTWESYHGVCVVYCNDARIEKRLTILQKYILKRLMAA